MVEIISMNKKVGFEAIQKNEIELAIDDKEPVEEVFVFRFRNGNYRMVCLKSAHTNNLYQIVDFNFTLYQH